MNNREKALQAWEEYNQTKLNMFTDFVKSKLGEDVEFTVEMDGETPIAHLKDIPEVTFWQEDSDLIANRNDLWRGRSYTIVNWKDVGRILSHIEDSKKEIES